MLEQKATIMACNDSSWPLLLCLPSVHLATKSLLPNLLVRFLGRTYDFKELDCYACYGRSLPSWSCLCHLVTYRQWSTFLGTSKSAPTSWWGRWGETTQRALQPPYKGCYKVFEHGGHSFKLDIRNRPKMVSLDRLKSRGRLYWKEEWAPCPQISLCDRLTMPQILCPKPLGFSWGWSLIIRNLIAASINCID